ncbi:hypothetical protein PR048_029211 [Dryococelus australis]|uniref:Uncharacterized protein n=1 Tax=Dryococelus australis TaxID=614101 RepID=A0ABQ9GCR2_9NEOP|nr:hypothetical protein PR048_029211 [Dryococelus australis]
MSLIARIHEAAAHVQAPQDVVTATEDIVLSSCLLCIREGGHRLEQFLELCDQLLYGINCKVVSKPLRFRCRCYWMAYSRLFTIRLVPMQSGFDSRRGRPGFSRVENLVAVSAGRGISRRSYPSTSGTSLSMRRTAFMWSVACEPWRILAVSGITTPRPVSASRTSSMQAKHHERGAEPEQKKQNHESAPLTVTLRLSEEIWAALNIEASRADAGEVRWVQRGAEMKWGWKREIPEKTRRPAVSSGTRFPFASLGEQLACSPPTKANRAQYPVGSLPGFCMGEWCLSILLVSEFYRGSPVSPVSSFRRCSILTPITLIGSLDLATSRTLRCERHMGWKYANIPHWPYVSHVAGAEGTVGWHQTSGKLTRRGHGRCAGTRACPRSPFFALALRPGLEDDIRGAIDARGVAEQQFVQRLETLVGQHDNSTARHIESEELRSSRRHDGNTARLARKSDEALEVRVSVVRIAPSLLDLGRVVSHGGPSHPQQASPEHD